MGLDSVELVMEVEEHFGISISNEEAERIRTVGDLVEICRMHIASVVADGDTHMRKFLALRNEVRHFMSDSQLRLQPKTRIVDVVPWQMRQAFWRRLETLIGVSPPWLERPPEVRWAVTIGIIATGVVCLLPPHGGIVFAAVGVVVATLGLLAITLPFQTVPPKTLATFGDITRRMVGGTSASRPYANADPAAILAELRPIIAEQLGVDEKLVVPEATFVEDLGMD